MKNLSQKKLSELKLMFCNSDNKEEKKLIAKAIEEKRLSLYGNREKSIFNSDKPFD